ncbi:GntR family transcriptional regulator [Testudinibacter sp. TR-2022]|uniref:GntR family transcriptional regulator n=1 Tax=Testudinibacter sp. TR-2022 TaxID=2585029 RepID=UPI0011199ED3|nr:GntR family transcriptional regulator [Testudinibacter sp. TR-2022]TNH03256.1 GntR family transcriptional regulator [Pasteurellaceae bacterium Phil31]TNH10923.1 GntR family transcriptional regulator [Testudinibacter sp. TR-2022]TNH12290.1 GntR family transcriptional regulator [Testudinibacter sp. TR-2022]TNH15028.1 GntR family transcriptional regulator [Testudinibacter sp. TR-2022]TNH20503.1 GntR family transcriptional regulator [Testudinibacter sp. TR-2022]
MTIITKKTPLYINIIEKLKREILSETIHGFLPSEAELQKMFGVSRSVIRQALAKLEVEGLISKAQGKGSFVLPVNRIHRVVQSLNGLGMQIEKMGTMVNTKIIFFELVDYDKANQFWNEKQALYLTRIRSDITQPIAYIETYLPTKYQRWLTPEKLANASLHQILKQDADVELERSTRHIYAIAAPSHIAEHLNIPIGSPLLLLKGTTFDKNNDVVEVFSTYHRGDKIMFDLETTI